MEYALSDEEDSAQAGCHGASTVPLEPNSEQEGRGSRRSAIRRRGKRVARQGADGNNDKHVAKKRRLEALKDAIVVDYSLPSDAPATKPGWIGKRVAELPQRVFSLTELVDTYGMKRFPWDGRWVPPVPSHFPASHHILDLPTSYLTETASL